MDDHDINREFLRIGLTRLVARLDAVSSGQEAIEQCRKAHYDVILMDLHMPLMDGLATLNRIRDLENSSARARTLILTADARPEERERLLAAGVDDYLHKPISIARLAEAIERLLGPRGQRSVTGPDDLFASARLIDFNRALAASNQDSAIAGRLSRMLGQELAEKLPELDLQLERGDYPAAASLLHQWAGAAGFAGATPFSLACRHLRQRLLEPEDSSPGVAYADFLRTALATRDALLTTPVTATDAD